LLNVPIAGINVAPLNVKVIGIETHEEEEGWSAPWAIIGALMPLDAIIYLVGSISKIPKHSP
jgi:hypothetical protein